MSQRASLLACALAALAALPAAAAESKIDPELLEFLGAFESEDDDFLDFLEQRPVEKPSAKKPEAAAKPADPKQVKKP